MVLDLLGPLGDKVCSSGLGSDVCIFPGVKEKEPFLIQCTGRKETKGLGQQEEPAPVAEGCDRCQKAREEAHRSSALWVITATLHTLQKPIVFFTISSAAKQKGFRTCE